MAFENNKSMLKFTVYNLLLCIISCVFFNVYIIGFYMLFFVVFCSFAIGGCTTNKKNTSYTPNAYCIHEFVCISFTNQTYYFFFVAFFLIRLLIILLLIYIDHNVFGVNNLFVVVNCYSNLSFSFDP